MEANNFNLTRQQKNQIESEVKTVLESIFKNSIRLDVDGALQYYSPEMVVVRGALLFDYQAWKKAWTDFFNSTSAFKWTTVHWECIVISEDLVTCSLVGKMEYVMKSGEKTMIDPLGWAHVCKKVDGKWKVIYENYSGIHVTQKADKN